MDRSHAHPRAPIFVTTLRRIVFSPTPVLIRLWITALAGLFVFLLMTRTYDISVRNAQANVITRMPSYVPVGDDVGMGWGTWKGDRSRSSEESLRSEILASHLVVNITIMEKKAGGGGKSDVGVGVVNGNKVEKGDGNTKVEPERKGEEGSARNTAAPHRTTGNPPLRTPPLKTSRISIIGVPALFGARVENTAHFPMMVLDDLNGCQPFTIELPRLTADDVRLIQEGKVNDPFGTYPVRDWEYDPVREVDHVSRSFDWFGLIPRGGCPFDVKAYHAHLAGLAGVLVYNNGTSPASAVGMSGGDMYVRMSASRFGHQVDDTLAVFLTHRDGMRLREAARVHAAVRRGEDMGRDGGVNAYKDDETNEWWSFAALVKRGARLFESTASSRPPTRDWLIISVASVPWHQHIPSPADGFPTDTILSMWTDLLSMLAVSIFCGVIFVLFCMTFAILKNYYLYGQMFPENPDAPRPLGAGASGMKKLEKVTFPLKVLTARDFGPGTRRGSGGGFAEVVGKGKDGDVSGTAPGGGASLNDAADEKSGQCGGLLSDCCAICIDEFVPGSRVRELPCRHVFHDTWYASGDRQFVEFRYFAPWLILPTLDHSVDPWLLRHNRLCPICKRDVLAPTTISDSSTSRSSSTVSSQDANPKPSRPTHLGRVPSSVSIPVPNDGMSTSSSTNPTNQSNSTSSRTATARPTPNTFWDDFVEDAFLLPNLALGLAQNIIEWWRDSRQPEHLHNNHVGFDPSEDVIDGGEEGSRLA
ncbi:hypothetical protein HDV00_010232 [Rhizophlyctis rosea]|nr:hypothetical protein HDV00_010232 [Rhizophlyctis rosea]